MNTLKSLPAIAQLEAVLTKNLLAGDDPARCKALVKLLRHSTDGRLRYDEVLVAVFPSDAQPANPGNVFTKFRQRVTAAAGDAGIGFELKVTGSKRAGASGMWLTFHGDDASAGGLRLPANPHYRATNYEEQRAAVPIKPIFLSNAEADATLVSEFVACLDVALRADPDERVRAWANKSWWHRKDLTQNLPHETMQRAIDDCKVGIILFSRNLVASDYVRDHELPRFDPRKLKSGDVLARDAIAVRLTSEAVGKIHAVVDHEEFQLLSWVAPDKKTRLSFEESDVRQREWICDQVVAELKRVLLPVPPTTRDSGVDSNELTQPATHINPRLVLPDDPRYECSAYDAAQSARTARIRRAASAIDGAESAQAGHVDIDVGTTVNTDVDVSALKHLTRWATEETSSRWFAVLGELGMGKTFLCRMLERQLNGTRGARRAIYVDLKASAVDAVANRSLTLESIIANALRVDYNQPPNVTVETVLDWVRNAGAVVIFDGLDELAVHLKDDGTRALITELLRVLPARQVTEEAGDVVGKQSSGKPKGRARRKTKGTAGKAVISCRTHYFPDIGTQNAQLLQAHRGNADENDVESFTLLPFTEEAIRRYFRNALGSERADSAFELISEVHNLRELAERPYLLSLITGQIGKLEVMRQRGETVNAASLYGLFADDWLQRDTGKHEFELAHKRTVMQALAAEMWRENARQWSWERMERWLNEFMLSVPGWAFRYAAKANVLAKDLRTATFIVRVGEDSFRFAHTSLQEYFLSGYLLDALTARELTKWDNLVPSDETFDFMWQRWQLMTSGVQRSAVDGLHDLLARAKPAHSAVAPLIAWQLYVLKQTENPAALVNLDGADVRGWRLAGTADRPMRLPNLSLRDADANALTVSHVDAIAVNASGAQLAQARLDHCDFQRANISGADMRGTTWRDVNLRDARIDGARLAGALLDQCDVSGSSLDAIDPLSVGAFVLLNPKRSPYAAKFTRLDVTSDCRAILTMGHTNSVACVAFSADGHALASGSWDHTVKLWDSATGREIMSFAGHQDVVTSIAFSPDGQTLASGSWDRSVKVWDVATGREKLSLHGHEHVISSVAFSSDGQTLASGSWDLTVKLWDVATAREKLTLVGHKDSVDSVAFSADGQTLSSGSWDHMVKLWDVATGCEIRSFAGHQDVVTSVAFSADGQTLASGSRDHTLKLWDVATGRETLSLSGHKNPISSVAFCEDGHVLASGSSDGTVKLWDVATGREKVSLTGHKNPISSIAFSSDGLTLASGSWDRTVKLWDVATGREKLSVVGHKNQISCVAFSADGQTLASGSWDDTVKLWDLETRREKSILAGHKGPISSVAFSADGQTLASGSWDETVKLWDVPTGREKLSLAGHKNSVESVAFSADGQTLASGSWDHTVKLWDAADGREIMILSGHQNVVTSVAFSEDGQTLASGSSDNTVKLWDVTTGRERLSLAGHKGPISCVAFSADGRTLASGSDDRSVKLWDVATGRKKLTFVGHKQPVCAVAFSADGRTLASGSSDTTVKLWDVATGREKVSLAGHRNLVSCVAFSANGETLVSGSWDNSVKFWDVATGHALSSFVSLPLGEWVTLDESATDEPELGLPVIEASDQAPHYLRQQWRNPVTGQFAWMPWVPPGSELWVSVGGGNDPKRE